MGAAVAEAGTHTGTGAAAGTGNSLPASHGGSDGNTTPASLRLLNGSAGHRLDDGSGSAAAVTAGPGSEANAAARAAGFGLEAEGAVGRSEMPSESPLQPLPLLLFQAELESMAAADVEAEGDETEGRGWRGEGGGLWRGLEGGGEDSREEEGKSEGQRLQGLKRWREDEGGNEDWRGSEGEGQGVRVAASEAGHEGATSQGGVAPVIAAEGGVDSREGASVRIPRVSAPLVRSCLSAPLAFPPRDERPEQAVHAAPAAPPSPLPLPGADTALSAGRVKAAPVESAQSTGAAAAQAIVPVIRPQPLLLRGNSGPLTLSWCGARTPAAPSRDSTAAATAALSAPADGDAATNDSAAVVSADASLAWPGQQLVQQQQQDHHPSQLPGSASAVAAVHYPPPLARASRVGGSTLQGRGLAGARSLPSPLPSFVTGFEVTQHLPSTVTPGTASMAAAGAPAAASAGLTASASAVAAAAVSGAHTPNVHRAGGGSGSGREAFVQAGRQVHSHVQVSACKKLLRLPDWVEGLGRRGGGGAEENSKKQQDGDRREGT